MKALHSVQALSGGHRPRDGSRRASPAAIDARNPSSGPSQGPSRFSATEHARDRLRHRRMSLREVATDPAVPEPKPEGPAPEGMVWIPGGKFWMGGDDSSWADARPVHEVTVDGFWMDRTEVTNRQFAAVREGDGLRHRRRTEARRQGFPRRATRDPRPRLAGLHPAGRSGARSMIRSSGGDMSRVPTGGIPRGPRRRSRARTIIPSSRSAGTMPSPMPDGRANASRPRPSGSSPRGAGRNGRRSSGAMN